MRRGAERAVSLIAGRKERRVRCRVYELVGHFSGSADVACAEDDE